LRKASLRKKEKKKTRFTGGQRERKEKKITLGRREFEKKGIAPARPIGRGGRPERKDGIVCIFPVTERKENFSAGCDEKDQPTCSSRKKEGACMGEPWKRISDDEHEGEKKEIPAPALEDESERSSEEKRISNPSLILEECPLDAEGEKRESRCVSLKKKASPPRKNGGRCLKEEDILLTLGKSSYLLHKPVVSAERERESKPLDKKIGPEGDTSLRVDNRHQGKKKRIRRATKEGGA